MAVRNANIMAARGMLGQGSHKLVLMIYSCCGRNQNFARSSRNGQDDTDWKGGNDHYE